MYTTGYMTAASAGTAELGQLGWFSIAVCMAPVGVRTPRPLEIFAIVLPLIRQAQAFSFPSISAVRRAGSARRTSRPAAIMATGNEGPHFVIDSHLHVWGDGKDPFPYAEGQAPPERLQLTSSPSVLLQEMDKAGVGGALVVQPINYKFDHSYVLDAIANCPGRLKAMCLANPSLTPQEATADLERLHDQGFCGVRFNPYLWAEGGEGMKDETGMALYRKAGELNMPVGVMCFKGLGLHMQDIEALLKSSPQTKLIVDHFGFFVQGGEVDEAAWEQLLTLAKYPQVHVKVSAFFRVATDPYPYPSLRPRFRTLLSTYGSKRLLWGTDFPFVVDGQCGYGPAKEAMFKNMGLTEDEVHDVAGGTAQALFGAWGDAA